MDKKQAGLFLIGLIALTTGLALDVLTGGLCLNGIMTNIVLWSLMAGFGYCIVTLTTED